MDPIFSACVSGRDQTTIRHRITTEQIETDGKRSDCIHNSLVIIFLLLIPPVLVQLVDFDGHIPLLRQVERLENNRCFCESHYSWFM